MRQGGEKSEGACLLNSLLLKSFLTSLSLSLAPAPLLFLISVFHFLSLVFVQLPHVLLPFLCPLPSLAFITLTVGCRGHWKAFALKMQRVSDQIFRLAPILNWIWL